MVRYVWSILSVCEDGSKERNARRPLFWQRQCGLALASAGAALLYWMRVMSLVSIHKDLPWESLLWDEDGAVSRGSRLDDVKWDSTLSHLLCSHALGWECVSIFLVPIAWHEFVETRDVQNHIFGNWLVSGLPFMSNPS